jgi:uncharacterized protein YecE (DUF72 family)
MALYVGTSGWAYREWLGSFYPPGLPYSSFLAHYGSALNACEVNATFYRIQSKASLSRWAEAVPDRFRFTVKAHRRLSYRKQLAPDQATRDFADEFLGSLAPLAGKLGCLLIQFPAFVECDVDALDRLLDVLPSGVRFALEFHHSSWDSPAVADLVAARGGTVCLRESEGRAPSRLLPGPLAYVRLKAASYPSRERQALLALLREQSVERDVYAFTRHKDVPPGDPHTGVGLAEWLFRASAGA